MKCEFSIKTTVIDAKVLAENNFYIINDKAEIGDTIYTVIYTKYIETDKSNFYTTKDFKFNYVVKHGEILSQFDLLNIINLLINRHG